MAAQISVVRAALLEFAARVSSNRFMMSLCRRLARESWKAPDVRQFDECFEEIAFKGIDCLLTCNGARPVLMTAERGKSVRDAKLAYRDRNETVRSA